MALKNDGGQVKQLLPYFDFAIVESCFDYSECSLYTPFIGAGKAVFETQYTDNGWTTGQFCSQANALDFNAILKHLSLDAWMQACRGGPTATTSSTTVTTSTQARASVTVKSEDLSGTLFTGMWTTVQSSDGTVLASGYTTFVFQGQAGVPYTVCVSDYGSTVFNHWGNGDTSSCKTATPTSNMVMTAYYST